MHNYDNQWKVGRVYRITVFIMNSDQENYVLIYKHVCNLCKVYLVCVGPNTNFEFKALALAAKPKCNKQARIMS